MERWPLFAETDAVAVAAAPMTPLLKIKGQEKCTVRHAYKPGAKIKRKVIIMNIDKIIQFLIVIIIFIIIIILLRQAVAEKKEKRIAYYSLEPLKDASIPLIDKIKNKYLIFVQKNRQILLKIDYFKKKSKKILR